MFGQTNESINKIILFLTIMVMYVTATYSFDMMHDEEAEDYGGHRLGGRSTVASYETVSRDNAPQGNVADAGTPMTRFVPVMQTCITC